MTAGEGWAIRKGEPPDADAIADLEVRLFGRAAWSRDSVREQFVDPGRVLTAIASDALLGYAITLVGGETAELHRLGVEPSHQNSGIGHSLLDEALRSARTSGCNEMLLEVSIDNAAARGLYASAGFTQIAVRERYYPDGSDAIVLRLALGASAD